MKRFTLLALLLTLLGSLARPAAATTFRVNNTLAPIATARLYNSLTTAQAAANTTAGDTLLVEGSGTTYLDFTCTKRLTIIGPGYLLTENPQNQANALPASVQVINFNVGSEGSAIIGLNFSPNYTGNVPNVAVNNISIIRCYLTNGISIANSITNLLILQNYITGYGIGVSYTGYSFSNVILKNNIINGPVYIDQYSSNPRIFSNVENNIFKGNVKLSANSFLSNIIAIATPSQPIAVTASSVQGNLIFTAGQLSTAGNANTLVTTPATLFVGLTAANGSTDGQYALPTASPYRMAGFGGTQPGIFGGSEPYVLSGVPPIPTIYSLRGDAIGSRQGGLNITIGARTNR